MYYGRPIYLDENGKPLEDAASKSTDDRPRSDDPKSVRETSDRQSVLVPESVEKPVQPATETMPVAPKPESGDNRSGDDSVNRVPITNQKPSEGNDAGSGEETAQPAAESAPSLDGPADERDDSGGSGSGVDDTVDA